jgi:hypothetical protein
MIELSSLKLSTPTSGLGLSAFLDPNRKFFAAPPPSHWLPHSLKIFTHVDLAWLLASCSNLHQSRTTQIHASEQFSSSDGKFST